jgi:PIN domain nuclease of toxin-antitoxin system
LKLLLDTHAALWWLGDHERVGAIATAHLMDSTNQVFLSATVVWEVAIKRSLGKLEAPDDLAATLIGAGALPLPISLEHADAVRQLPWHHRDPFDRLLVAQATIERAAVVSSDPALDRYDIAVVW